MRTAAPNSELLDRLMAGDTLAEPVPLGYDRLADLVRDSTSPPVPSELTPPPGLLAAMAEAASHADRDELARRRILRCVTAKTAIAAIVVLSATGAAAATGHLPPPAQAVVAATAAHVGVDLPLPDVGPDSPVSTSPSRPDSAATSGSPSSGPPSEQPGASADSTNDNRPACAGNPSSDVPGCAVGQQTSSAPGNSDATVHGTPNPGVPPTTVHIDHEQGTPPTTQPKDLAHDPNSHASRP